MKRLLIVVRPNETGEKFHKFSRFVHRLEEGISMSCAATSPQSTFSEAHGILFRAKVCDDPFQSLLNHFSSLNFVFQSDLRIAVIKSKCLLCVVLEKGQLV